MSKRQEQRREARGTQVTQYDLEGKPIAWFNSLADAAEAAHCHYTNISATIRGKVRTGGGFQWRSGHKRIYRYLRNHKDVFPCFNSFYEFLQQHFVEELKADGVKDRDFDINNFLYVLRPYYKGGEFDYLLNAKENLDVLHQPFIVFELDNVKDHPILFPVINLIIMEMFISKMRKLRVSEK